MIPRLCYITDGARGTGGRPLVEVIARAHDGGVGMAVLRERDREVSGWRVLIAGLAPQRARGLKLLASRRLDLVRALGLDGVHLAADAVQVAEARAWLGPDAWIGYSAHEAEEARAAAAAGASYVTLSPIYPTASKPGHPGRGPDWLHRATRNLTVPALALGGMTPERVAPVLAAGAWGVAAVSAIGAAECPEHAAHSFVQALEGGDPAA